MNGAALEDRSLGADGISICGMVAGAGGAVRHPTIVPSAGKGNVGAPIVAGGDAALAVADVAA